jgi:hypothetical protein
MSPACKFVLAVAGSHLSSRATIVAPPAAFDWKEAIAFAEHHGLIPLFCWNLRAHGIRIPDSLDLDARRQAAGALKLSATLVQISKTLAERDIPTIAFKGPSLASLLYSNVTLRSYSDLDFLISREKVKEACSVLQTEGWIAVEKLPSIPEEWFLQSQCEYGFVRNKTLIELQWALAPRFYALDLPLEDMFRRAVTVDVLGASVKTLAPDDLFLVLAVHGAKHLWTRLNWVLDIAALLASETTDSTQIIKIAKHCHLERIVAVAVLLAARISDVRIPATLETLAASDAEASKIASALFGNAISGAQNYPSESLAFFRVSACLRERWQDRARQFVRLFLTPGLSEMQLLRLPRGTRWLYRPIRVLRLTRRFLLGNW